PAIDWLGGAPTSAAQMRAMIHGLAAHLHDRGVKPGDRVLIEVPPGELFVAAVMGSQWLGAVPVLIEPSLGPALSQTCIEMVEPRWNIVHPLIMALDRVPGMPRFLRRLEIDLPVVPSSSVKRVVLTMSRLKSLSISSPEGDVYPVDPDADNLIVFTGGTTEIPKGVRVSNTGAAALMGNIGALIDDLPSFKKFLADTPQQVLFALCLGREVMTTKGRKAKRARYVFDAIMSGKIEAYFSSPFVWQWMMEAKRDEVERLPSTLKTVLLGGATVSRPFLEKLAAWLHPSTEVVCIYGLTEAGPVCTSSLSEKLSWEGGGDLVGAPLPGMDIRIESPDEGGRGAVVVHGPSLYSGYLGQPDRAPDEGLVTGDIGRLEESADGQRRLVLLGRAKDMVIRQGLNIYPQTMEPFLLGLRDKKGEPLFAECALVGMWDKSRNDGYVVLATRRNEDAERWSDAAIRSKLREVLGSSAE
ncbi:MAG: class I adenylate-forming enzyme family protein, partial [Bradymonadaceae bacterium]